MDLVWSMESRWTTMERALATVLAGHSPNMFPGGQRLAKLAGICPRTARKALGVLVNGDPARDLPPLFTRRKRGDEERAANKGGVYRYEFVTSPAKLQEDRDREGLRFVAKLASVQGNPRPELKVAEPAIVQSSTHPGPSGLKASAEDLYREGKLSKAELLKIRAIFDKQPAPDAT